MKKVKIFTCFLLTMILCISINVVNAYTIYDPDAGDISVSIDSNPGAGYSATFDGIQVPAEGGYSNHLAAVHFLLSFNANGKSYSNFRVYCEFSLT